jgi:chitinase
LDIQGNGTTHSASDRTNFTLLLQEFRTQLDALQATSSQEYLLTAAVLTGDDHVIQTDPASYSTYLNWVNVMAYDYQGAWAATGPTSHHSQLLTAGAPRNDPYNTAGFDKRTVVTALSRIPANKIVMGIPFYARGWTGVNVSNSAPGLLGLYAPATGAAPGTYEPGIEDYKKIRKLRGVETYDSDVVATSKVIYPTYYFMYSAQNNPTWVSATFWSYDSPRSIQDKIAYIKQRNYAGIYGWSIDGDTADGELVDAMNKLLQ